MTPFIHNLKECWPETMFVAFGLAVMVIGPYYPTGTISRMRPSYFLTVLDTLPRRAFGQ